MLTFIASVGSFLPGLFGKQLSFKAAKIVGGIVLVLLLVAVLAIGKCAYDASVINDYEVQHDAAAAKKTLEADRTADAEIANKAAQFEETQDKLEDAMRNAAQADPKGAGTAVGPVTRSYYDNLPRKDRK